MRKIFRILLIVIIGPLLLATGIGRALGIPGYIVVLETYQSFPLILHWPIALLVILIELLVGLAILLPKFLRIGSYLAIWMHLAYASLAAITLLRGIDVPNCGCFGVFLARPLGWNTVTEDLVMTGLAYALYRLR